MTSSSVKRNEILKWWAEHKGFEYFMEDMEKVLNTNRLEIAKLDLFNDDDRNKWVKIQSNILCITELLQTIKNYNNVSQVVLDESKNLT